MSRRLAFALVLAALLFCTSTPGDGRAQSKAGGARRESRDKKVTSYACPMHPRVTSRRPGRCPECGMDLRPVEEKADAPAGDASNNAGGPETKGSGANSAADSGAATTPRIPDITVYNQNGRRLNFYTDLVKGRTVAINFIFTTCTTICPPLTATFRRVQQQLGERADSDVTLISISVDPTTDTPERLYDFAEKFKVGPGWTFVTGDKAEIDSLLRALGAAVPDKTDHTAMILVGNEPAGYWTRTYGLSSPTALVKVITEAANHK